MRFTIAILFLLSQTSIFGQAVRKYSNEFMNIGVGARALGMANAQVASTNDVLSGFWNPAGLNFANKDMQVSLMHSEYFAGIAKFDYGAISKPIMGGNKVAGFSFIRLGVDDIANTLFLVEPDGSINYDNITSFSAADYAFLFSFAQKIKLKEHALSFGANAKIIHRKVGPFGKSWGFGLDAGLQYSIKKWQFGLMAKDITTTFNAWSFNLTDEEKNVLLSTGNEIPTNSLELTLPKFILGAAYKHQFGEKIGLLSEMNIDITTDGKRNVLIRTNPLSFDPHLGLEGNYNNIVFLRMGIGNLQRATQDITDKNILLLQPNIGIGLKIRNFYIDYALSKLNTAIPVYSHFFSLKYDFNKSNKTEKIIF